MPALTAAIGSRAYRNRNAPRTTVPPAVAPMPTPAPIARPERSGGPRRSAETWQTAYAAHRGMSVEQIAAMLASETSRETMDRHIAETLAEPFPHPNYYVPAADPDVRWTWA